ncbi:hypothetical protein LTR17_027284, partial [Elasticomyces elasticus]
SSTSAARTDTTNELHVREIQTPKAQQKSVVDKLGGDSEEDYQPILKSEVQVRNLEFGNKDLTVKLENLKNGTIEISLAQFTHKQKCGVLTSQYLSLGDENMALRCKSEEAESKAGQMKGWVLEDLRAGQGRRVTAS